MHNQHHGSITFSSVSTPLYHNLTLLILFFIKSSWLYVGYITWYCSPVKEYYSWKYKGCVQVRKEPEGCLSREEGGL